MKSQNYDPTLGYFAVRYAGGVQHVVTTYAVHPKTLADITGKLKGFEKSHFREQEIKTILEHHGAFISDYENDKTGKLHPGVLKYALDSAEITQAHFYNKGVLNHPADNFPAKIAFKNCPRLDFIENGIETYRLFSPKTPKEYYFTETDHGFQTKFDDLITCLKDPNLVLGVPVLLNKHSVEILKL